ncbi:hypothetical protein ACWC2T_40405 [Streptomyces sp. NPDC001393]
MEQMIRAYGVPGRLAEYLPDRDEPVERWFNAPNTGNARAIARTIIDLTPEFPAVVLDPFCGAGSSAIAARHLGIPFVGMEIDPVLACVSLAKSHCEPVHGAGLHRPERSDDDLPLRCLRVVQELQSLDGSGRLNEQQITEDLARAPAAVPGGAMVCGDSTVPANWSDLSIPDRDVVVFTSPPFYSTWSPPHVPERVRRAASAVFCDTKPARLGRPDTQPQPSGQYCDLVIGSLRAMMSVAAHGIAIIEHEPGDDSTGKRLQVLSDRINEETEGEVVEILATDDFSGAGILSLVVCRF